MWPQNEDQKIHTMEPSTVKGCLTVVCFYKPGIFSKFAEIFKKKKWWVRDYNLSKRRILMKIWNLTSSWLAWGVGGCIASTPEQEAFSIESYWKEWIGGKKRKRCKKGGGWKGKVKISWRGDSRDWSSDWLPFSKKKTLTWFPYLVMFHSSVMHHILSWIPAFKPHKSPCVGLWKLHTKKYCLLTVLVLQIISEIAASDTATDLSLALERGKRQKCFFWARASACTKMLPP